MECLTLSVITLCIYVWNVYMNRVFDTQCYNTVYMSVECVHVWSVYMYGVFDIECYNTVYVGHKQSNHSLLSKPRMPHLT